MDALHRVQAERRAIDDDLRWLVALVSDTGMRVAETAGLLRKYLVLDAAIPYVRITPHEWRPLRTNGSKKWWCR
jgi:integrase